MTRTPTARPRPATTILTLALLCGSLLAVVSCSLELRSQFSGHDLFQYDEGAPILQAAYLFNGDISENIGSSDLRTRDIETDVLQPLEDVYYDFVPDRSGRTANAIVLERDAEFQLPSNILPRTLTFWVRLPDLEGFDLQEWSEPGITVSLSEPPREDGFGQAYMSLSSRVGRIFESDDLYLARSLRARPGGTVFYGTGANVERQQPVDNADGWQLGEWHHMAALWDRAGFMSLFVDGELIGTSRLSIEAENLATTDRVVIGSRQPDWQYSDPGDPDSEPPAVEDFAAIDDLLLFETALSPDQIRAIYEDTLELPFE